MGYLLGYGLISVDRAVSCGHLESPAMEMLTVFTSSFPATKQPHPFPMQGSKRGQVPIINNLIPEGKPRLIEPFCGSAAVSIGAMQAGLVSEAVISDINPSLMHLWDAILSDPETLAGEYERIWAGQFEEGQAPREYFLALRNQYNARPEDVEDAPVFLFILNRIVKSALRYSGRRMTQSADNRRTGAKPSAVFRRVTETKHVLEGSEALCRDWREALDMAGAEDVVYMDPPYQGTTDTRDTRYISGLNVDAFEDGVREAVKCDKSLIISYDALVGPAIYGRPLDPAIGLLPLDVVTGVSAQGTLLGRAQEAHETLYLSPALVDRLGGVDEVRRRVSGHDTTQMSLLDV